jgi:hypothetical protein
MDHLHCRFLIQLQTACNNIWSTLILCAKLQIHILLYKSINMVLKICAVGCKQKLYNVKIIPSLPTVHVLLEISYFDY